MPRSTSAAPSHPSPPSNHFILNNQLLAANFKSSWAALSVGQECCIMAKTRTFNSIKENVHHDNDECRSGQQIGGNDLDSYLTDLRQDDCKIVESQSLTVRLRRAVRLQREGGRHFRWLCRLDDRRPRAGCWVGVADPGGGGTGCWRAVRTAVCGRTERAARPGCLLM
jgi:hypothetical protein